eukprot:Rhum_TRINITY_DN8017_c0_g1::Rhum_TRINITY_DN8017_c0_g1_i1::g.25715::m.25715
MLCLTCLYPSSPPPKYDCRGFTRCGESPCVPGHGDVACWPYTPACASVVCSILPLPSIESNNSGEAWCRVGSSESPAGLDGKAVPYRTDTGATAGGGGHPHVRQAHV